MTNGLEQIVETHWLTSENILFFSSSTGLLMYSEDGGNTSARAFLARAFPFEAEEQFISLLTEEKEEVGIIRSLSDFDEKTGELLRAELKRKYFAPKILKIKKVAARMGGSFWECETDLGPLSFSVKDTYRSLLRPTKTRIFVVDSDGCRYEIEDVTKLDRKSHSQIEIYL